MVLGLTLFCSAKLTCSLATHYTFKMYIYIHTYICVCVCIYNALQEKPLCRYKSNTLHVSKKFTSQYNLCYRWPLNKLSVFLIPLLNTYADLYPWCFWLGGLLQLGCSKGASPTEKTGTRLSMQLNCNTCSVTTLISIQREGPDQPEQNKLFMIPFGNMHSIFSFLEEV